MSEITKGIGVIFLDRIKLEYFDLTRKKSLVFNFPPNIVSDLEVVNRHDLETQLILFINFYKINPISLVIILSEEVCFEKIIEEAGTSGFESYVNNFLYYLPFENTVHKIYKQEKGYRVVAVNRDLIESIKQIFSKMGFLIEAIVPTSVIGINVKTLDPPTAEFVSAKLNVIKEQSIVHTQPIYKKKHTEEKKVMGVKRVFLLFGLFALLLMILLYLLYNQSMSTKSPNVSISLFYTRSISLDKDLS